MAKGAGDIESHDFSFAIDQGSAAVLWFQDLVVVKGAGEVVATLAEFPAPSAERRERIVPAGGCSVKGSGGFGLANIEDWFERDFLVAAFDDDGDFFSGPVFGDGLTELLGSVDGFSIHLDYFVAFEEPDFISRAVEVDTRDDSGSGFGRETDTKVCAWFF